ncbi:MAG: hypothetical protein AUK63_1428 [bacterium P3]|nr:MAG: hypothetical protein AUK63_1428 [bacterium P3]KWW40079.1 MAG: hypothetical protein F083_1801 [bacterium F083]
MEVCARNIDHAAALAAQVGAQAVSGPAELDTAVDFCIVAVNDDALPAVAGQLHLPHSVTVHTSGATEAEVLRGVSPHYGVLWSPMSFVRQEAMDYSSLPFCIEGSDAAAADAVERLARRVSGRVCRMDAGQRRWAHLSATVVNNFGNAMLAEVQRMAAQERLPFDLLLPIVNQTAQRAALDNLWSRQTGPAVRQDRNTIAAHRAMLAGHPRMLELYDVFTRLIADRDSSQ